MSAFNGSGVFVLTGPEYPAVALTLIQAAYRNSLDSAFATGLSTCLTKDGQTTATGNIPMGGFKLTGLGAGTARTDAASLASIQDGTAIYVPTVGGTANAVTLTPSPAITSYATGQRFVWIVGTSNIAGGITIAVSGLAAKNLSVNANTTNLSPGVLHGAALAEIIYTGVLFELITNNPSTVNIDARAWKTSDQTRISTTTLTEDADLTIPISIGTFQLEYFLDFDATTTAGMGFKYSVAFNGTSTMTRGIAMENVNATAATTVLGTHGTRTFANISTTADSNMIYFTGTLVITAAGSVSIAWAQNSSTANNLTLRAGSHLLLRKLS